jgi:hypothetical protein
VTARTPKRVCNREGCGRFIPRRRISGDTCSILCEVVAKELESAQRLTAATGDGELWEAAVAINDSLTAYCLSQSRVYRAARAVGITPEQWRALREGTGP